MELVVDCSEGSVVLSHRDNFERFAVRSLPRGTADGSPDATAEGALAVELRRADAGSIDPSGDVHVPADAVRRLAAEAAAQEGRSLDPGWENGFAAMVEYAAEHGWTAEDGSIRAHVEWGE